MSNNISNNIHTKKLCHICNFYVIKNYQSQKLFLNKKDKKYITLQNTKNLQRKVVKKIKCFCGIEHKYFFTF